MPRHSPVRGHERPQTTTDAGLGGARGVLAAASAWRAANRPFALALVIETQDSTYRKPGAFATIAANGDRRGALSGGCLEAGIEALAMRALETRKPQSAEFDTRDDDDLVFGSGSGCRGRMRVMTLPVHCDAPAPLHDAIVEAMEQDELLRVALAMDPVQGFHGVAWTPARAIPIDLTHDDVAALASLRRAATGRHRALLGGRETDVSVFDMRPPSRLLLLGAGPEAPPILRFARTLGWFTVVADHREALLTPQRLCADRLLAARPTAACDALAPQRFDAAIAMTHLAGADLDALRALAVCDVAYIGLLGPPARRDELLMQLDEGARVALRGRLHAPVGLPLGGEGPEAIALSIVADLQRHFARNA